MATGELAKRFSNWLDEHGLREQYGRADQATAVRIWWAFVRSLGNV